MNFCEFASKTLIFYSIKKNERIDLSCLPDDIFDKLLAGLYDSRMCVEGSPFTGKYIKDNKKVAAFKEMLTKEITPTYPRLNRVMSYIDGLADGAIFRIVSEDAPTMNKQLAVEKIKGLAAGENERWIHYDYLMRVGSLSTRYNHLAFGYDGLQTFVGVNIKNKRVCRFCRKSMPEVKFRHDAHAISEGLGNKILFCNEECDTCNDKLSKVENNLIHYLDVRRALGGILTKSGGSVPSVDGKGFVIRGDKNNTATLYIEEESLPQGLDTQKPFKMKLESVETITHQGIYKALCKIVIDLLPSSELSHFHETIDWINGSVIDSELPPYYAAYDCNSVQQPTVDIFLSNKPGYEPYCTVVVHILDVFFVFIVPEVDVDRAQFNSVDSFEGHIEKFLKAYAKRWQLEDSSDYKLSFPWVNWIVDPHSPHVQIRPKSDPVFIRYKREKDQRDEVTFPVFSSVGISEPVVSKIVFNQHSFEPVTMADLKQVSVNYQRLDCILDKSVSTAIFSVALNFSDSSNRVSYFDFSFSASVKLVCFDKYIKTESYFCIDYHLRDFLFVAIFSAADIELRKYTRGTDLERITLTKLIDLRTMIQLDYYVPVDGDKYMVVKDASIHNL